MKGSVLAIGMGVMTSNVGGVDCCWTDNVGGVDCCWTADVGGGLGQCSAARGEHAAWSLQAAIILEMSAACASVMQTCSAV